VVVRPADPALGRRRPWLRDVVARLATSRTCWPRFVHCASRAPALNFAQVIQLEAYLGGAVATKSPLPIDVLVGHNIRIGRLQVALSQTELGARVGVTFQQIQKYEKGANRIGASRLQQIADALRVPIPTLFDGAPTAHHSSQQSVRGILAKPQALRLLLAFDQINDEAARRVVLHLVESIPQGAGRRLRKRNGG
jgi:transcriptional regulator with XRE-family HTH domain